MAEELTVKNCALSQDLNVTVTNKQRTLLKLLMLLERCYIIFIKTINYQKDLYGKSKNSRPLINRLHEPEFSLMEKVEA